MHITSPFNEPPTVGSLLLASPSLQDGTFDNSVILISEFADDTGAEGVILNCPTGQNVGDVMCSNDFKKLQNLPIFYGGPVDEDKLSFMSFRWSKAGKLDCEIGISAPDAAEAMSRSGTLVKAFVGKSTWTQGQLEGELEGHAWYVASPFKSLLTMPQDETLWKNTLQKLSPFHHIISLTPENPFLN